MKLAVTSLLLLTLLTSISNLDSYLGQPGLYGSLEPGCVTDLVVLDTNPLDDIYNSGKIHGVMRAGRWHNREPLDLMMLEGVAERAMGKP